MPSKSFGEWYEDQKKEPVSKLPFNQTILLQADGFHRYLIQEMEITEMWSQSGADGWNKDIRSV
ncbi:hypothetical protein JH06_2901 [Blastocystis sp. subtype 4]|uniref:hypothetical protein n=1 Tax=Blastocystis sp. subtype 4 TaxID=944170 RepID=UPI0007113BA0|nr:hypothetical protein JH06_2901 [Blastocystis sp. subtype 4]KNB43590.1 hypothetical protein JH06_2901 [Blastocystis sp. subtype 4]|eukprot:XP_014527033.1 hypothetical protein JH06_2901 [Blastocystis sp. subtype 4]